MTSGGDGGPPPEVRYDLDEALDLLAVFEDATDALLDSGHLVVVLALEGQVRDLGRRLGFDDPDGGADAW